MKNNLTNSEKEISQKFDSFNEEVDVDKLWYGIKDSIPSRKKKNRPVFIWFLCGLLILILGGLSYKYAINIEENEHHTVDKKNATEFVNQKNEIPAHNPQTANKENQQPLKVQKPIKDDQITKAASYSDTRESSSSTHHILSKRQDEPKSTNLQNQEDLNIQFSNTKSEKIQNTNDVITTSDESPTKRSSSNFKMDHNISGAISNKVSEKTKDITILETLDPLPISEINYEYLSLITSKIRTSQSKIEWKTYYTMSTGINQLMLNSSIGGHEKPNISETSMIGMSAQIGIGINSSNGWRFSSDFLYTRQVIRISYTSESIEYDVIPTDNNIFINQHGEENTTGGFRSRTTIVNQREKKHRYHDYFGLALSMSKQFLSFKRFSASPTLSTNIYIHAKHSGYIVNGAGIVERISPGSTTFTSPLFTINTGLNLAYKLNKLSIFAEPYIGKSLNKYSKIKDSRYSRKTTQYGLKLGINYQPF